MPEHLPPQPFTRLIATLLQVHYRLYIEAIGGCGPYRKPCITFPTGQCPTMSFLLEWVPAGWAKSLGYPNSKPGYPTSSRVVQIPAWLSRFQPGCPDSKPGYATRLQCCNRASCVGRIDSIVLFFLTGQLSSSCLVTDSCLVILL